MTSYRLEIDNPIPLILLIPVTLNKQGVVQKTFPTIEEALSYKDENKRPINLFYGSFKTYGGTETDINGIHSIMDTANIETWYRPDIKSDCRIVRANDNAIFDIINEPEDINQRHQFLKFKVKRIKGEP